MVEKEDRNNSVLPSSPDFAVTPVTEIISPIEHLSINLA
jgi:hypothetical protein